MSKDQALTDGMVPERVANVLLIDDRRADVELTRVYLQVRDRMRFNLLVAHGGTEALGLMRQAVGRGETIDLLLVDINMPGMDGFELLETVGHDPALKEIAVIMCTGSSYDQDQARARALGAAGYMVKPASLAQLKPVLADIPVLRLDDEAGDVRLMRAA
jgi:CheY-like chemotaxis protein